MAERHILAALLSEPQRWHDVQQTVHVEDFTDAARRRLAEVYWAHQRDEGEPVFNEFLSQLSEIDQGQPRIGLAELAIELVEEAETLPGLDDALKGAVLHLEEIRSRRENQKLTAPGGAGRSLPAEKTSGEEPPAGSAAGRLLIPGCLFDASAAHV
jgi:hypothetical protein